MIKRTDVIHNKNSDHYKYAEEIGGFWAWI